MDESFRYVFDLDDTLYAERDYVLSAFTSISRSIAARFDIEDPKRRLRKLWDEGTANPIAVLWNELQLPEDLRAEFIETMRAHPPSITLRPDAASLIERLRRAGLPYAIVTDGRSVTQRAKIAALGCLDAAYISISEEVGLAKTDPERFVDVERRLGPGKFVYIGDNPAKDFVAPNQRGWLTAMLSGSGAGIHPQTLPADAAYHPRVVGSNFAEIVTKLEAFR